MSAPAWESADLDALRGCPETGLHWAAAGWRAGHTDGFEAGRQAADADMAAAWHAVYLDITATLKQPLYSVVQTLRATVNNTRCDAPSCAGRCSACIRAEAWERNGQRDYLGVQAEAELKAAS